MPITRRLFSLCCLGLPLVALTARPAAAATHQVAMTSMKFSPKTLTIAAGDKVSFANKDGVPHTATAKDGSFNTGRLADGQSASITFATPGEYAYYCTVHPMMKGTITVT
jgi:plastocyanin